jgi:hypothetical protein
MFMLSRDLASYEVDLGGDALRHLFCPLYWRPRWTQLALIKLLAGTSVERIFHRGNYFSPLGVTAYSWVKP